MIPALRLKNEGLSIVFYLKNQFSNQKESAKLALL